MIWFVKPPLCFDFIMIRKVLDSFENLRREPAADATGLDVRRRHQALRYPPIELCRSDSEVVLDILDRQKAWPPIPFTLAHDHFP
jgi:hypothetical protein